MADDYAKRIIVFRVTREGKREEGNDRFLSSREFHELFFEKEVLCDGSLMATTTVLVLVLVFLVCITVSASNTCGVSTRTEQSPCPIGEWNVKGAGPHTCHTVLRTSTATLHTFALLVHV